MSRSIQQTVITLIQKLMGTQHLPLVALALDTRISDLGISSLGLAELVSELEQVFEVDPFEDDRSITDVVTVGDLVAAYQECVPA